MTNTFEVMFTMPDGLRWWEYVRDSLYGDLCAEVDRAHEQQGHVIDETWRFVIRIRPAQEANQ